MAAALSLHIKRLGYQTENVCVGRVCVYGGGGGGMGQSIVSGIVVTRM